MTKGLIAFFLVATLAACTSNPMRMRERAEQSLQTGYVQLEADNEALAIQAFKDAEHYGLLAGDSLTVSRARYEIGDMMYRKGETKEEYIGRLKAADEGLGTHYDERAKLQRKAGNPEEI